MSDDLPRDPILKEYRVRPPEMSDAAAAAELHNIWSIALTGKKEVEPVDYANNWQAPDFDKDASVRLVFTPEGELVGNFYLADHLAPYVQIRLGVFVHPDHRDNGMPEAMLGWAEGRAMQSVDKAPEGAQVELRSGANHEDVFKKELLEEFGMELIRHFFRMEIEFDGPPPVPELPKEITIRPYRPESEIKAIAVAYQDSFRDHFGYVEEPLEKLLEGVQHMIANDPHYDPNFWFVAVEGDEIAGFSLCAPRMTEDPELGWVNVLGVRRPWRGRGLGLALLQHSFVKLYQNGSKRAGLGVDASSLTGATRLYKKAGMSVTRQMDAYRKILREGQDITTTEI